MNMRIVFRHMEPVASIENYAHDAMRRVMDILAEERDPVNVDLILEASTNHGHNRVELHVTSPRYDLITHHEGPEFYKELDHVIDVMVRLLHEEKRRQVDARKERKKTSETGEFGGFHGEDEEADIFDEEDEFEDVDLEFEEEDFED
jgi:ribosome-associated translation inhibitor RaiA